MNNRLKKLTGKNANDFQPVAFELINKPDIELFKELVDNDEYLFDFVKNNVALRLEKQCNSGNYLNLLQFLKFYSPSYEDFIISTLVKYADEDLTDSMLEIFENGNDDEKIYCAKFFSKVQDPLALELLNKYSMGDNDYLSTNCAVALGAFGDEESKNKAYELLNSQEEFNRLNAVKFLISYGDKGAYDAIISAIKSSALAEHMACEVPYLFDLYELITKDFDNALLIINLIINGLGETSSLEQAFDFRLYDIFDYLIKSKIQSKTAITLLNAFEKFEALTENDEYLFDQTQNVKQEIGDIKGLLARINKSALLSEVDKELDENSSFVFWALEYTKNTAAVRKLLSAHNQTLVLKTIETLKSLNDLNQNDKDFALNSVTNEYIKEIINAL